MLKYIGDLDLLVSKYGFEQDYEKFKDNDFGFKTIIIGKDNDVNFEVGKSVYLRLENHGGYYKIGSTDTLYDLIKDGLVEKVDD